MVVAVGAALAVAVAVALGGAVAVAAGSFPPPQPARKITPAQTARIAM